MLKRLGYDAIYLVQYSIIIFIQPSAHWQFTIAYYVIIDGLCQLGDASFHLRRVNTV